MTQKNDSEELLALKKLYACFNGKGQIDERYTNQLLDALAYAHDVLKKNEES